MANVNDVIAHAVAGMDAADQAALDERLIELDGTRTRPGSAPTRVLSVSMAAAHAAAAAAGHAAVPLSRRTRMPR